MRSRSLGWNRGRTRRMLPIEVSLAVERALERLSDDQREAVVLKIYQGFKFEEMAEILDCPVSTVKSRLYTALDLLKDTLTVGRNAGIRMTCSPFDLKDYFFGELNAEHRELVEQHVAACSALPG